MITSLRDAVLCELADVPEDIQNRVLKVIKEWDNGEIWRKLKRDHDDRLRRMYEKFIRHGDLVFDVGANVGERSEIFLSLGATVVAVEPHPDCLNKLRNKFAGNPCVSIVPKALGASDGEGLLRISDAATGCSSMSREWLDAVRQTNRFGIEWDKQLTVEVTTLDALIQTFGRPSFVKIDVEGFEPEVLDGLSSPVASLSFEFTPETQARTEYCLRRLESLGAPKFSYSIGETTEIHPEWLSGNEVLQYLARYIGDSTIYGDVYAQFQ